jgi:hypothetical protein
VGRTETATDGAAPGIGAEGIDVFVLGKVKCLHEGLAEIGEGGGGFGLHLALSDGGEEASEGGAEIAGGDVAVGEMAGDVLAGLVAGKGLVFFAGVEDAKIRMTGFAGRAAVAAIGEGERAEGGAVILACWCGAANLGCGSGTINCICGRRADVLACDRGTAVFRYDRRAVNFMRGRRTANGAIRHGNSPERKILDFLGESRGGEAHC